MAALPSRVGFIGLGVMGYPMALNLAEKLPKDATIHVYDVAEEAIRRLIEEKGGGRRIVACKSAKEVAESTDVVLSMVPEGSHVKAVYLTPDTGVLAANIDSKLLIDCSTIDTATSLEVRDAVKQRSSSAAFYDAPVSGGVLGAQKGTMTFMLGCAKSSPDVERTTALLSLMGGHVIPCGGPSLGLTAKLCNNYCSGLIAIATSEAMNIGIKSGMDPRVLADVFHVSLAQSCINDKWNPCPGVVPDAPASKGYAPGFKINLMRKDFNLAVETANRVGARLALGEKGLEVYTDAMHDDKCKDLDSRVVYRYLGGDEDWAQRFEGGEKPS